MSALTVPDVEDQWSLTTDVPLGTLFSAPRGVKDLLRQRRSSSGEGKRPTTSSSQPVTPPVMPADEYGRAARGSRRLDERISAPEQFELEPEPEPSPATDREHEERERRRRRRRKKHAKQHAGEGEGECGEVASWEPSSGSIRPPRQRTPECSLATSGTQSPRARKAAQRVVDRPTGEACRASEDARARRRNKMHDGRKEDSRSRILQRGGCEIPHATPAEGKATATKTPAATAPHIRLLVETESTQTNDDLLQELLRRRRAYLNEQSQLDGRESASVIKAHEEADQFFAQASQRAREEAMKTVDASTCLKAALWNGGQQRAQQELGAPQPKVPGAANVVPSPQAQNQNQLELVAEAATAAKHADVSSFPDAGKQTATAPAPAQKNTRGFRLRR